MVNAKTVDMNINQMCYKLQRKRLRSEPHEDIMGAAPNAIVLLEENSVGYKLSDVYSNSYLSTSLLAYYYCYQTVMELS
jgi:hypothetical protein